ncbi:hypothetical protein [Formosa sp. S-31]|uniref:hypothetical protein n=1 Tax=Formosa sp. S-31 TaxID=2790949 RepID=UPI003EB8D5F1
MKKHEICRNCGEEYIPKRRGVQKYCSNSCRSSSWQLKQKKPQKETSLKPVNPPVVVEEETKEASPEKQGMSLAGVGNNMAGNLSYDMLKSMLTPTENKPASKKDIGELKNLILGSRYLPVNNVPKDKHGRLAFYDVNTGNVVFLKA